MRCARAATRVEVLEVEPTTARWRCWLAAELAAAAAARRAARCRATRSRRSSAERRPPVVFVVFDEFPADDLLRPDGSIDAERFPNFARAGRRSPPGSRTRHTVYDSTFGAVPAILDGRMPRRADGHRRAEPQAERLPRDGPARLRGVQGGVGVGGVPAGDLPGRAHAAARGARRGSPATAGRRASTSGSARSGRRPQPAFYFQHALMPHEPWIYLPSGHQSRPAGEEPIRTVNHVAGFDDADLTDHNHLRHLLQVGYTDRLVGELLARLEAHRPARARAHRGHGRPRLLVPGRRGEPAPAERATTSRRSRRCRCS